MQVLENSMATSEERLEQLRRVGCRPTRRLPAVTGSTAVRGWTAAQRSSLRRSTHERSSASFVPRSSSNATNTRNVIVLEEATNASRSMKVMGVNLRVHYENSMRCDKPSATNLVSRTFRRGTSADSTLGVSAGRFKPKDSNTRRAIDQ